MNKKILLFIFTCSLYLIGCTTKSQDNSLSYIQIFDRNGFSETISSEDKIQKYQNIDFEKPQAYKKVLRIYKKDEMGNVSSILTTYHPNGHIAKYLQIKDSRAYGIYKEWHLNGSLKIEANIIGGPADFNSQEDWIFDGICKAYDNKENLISEFFYEKGSLEKEAKYYYPNSNIQKIVPYSNNEINGTALEYNENNELISKTTYLNGIKEGPSTSYWSPNNILSIEEYENNLLKHGQYFNKNRTKISAIKNGFGKKSIIKSEKLYQLIEYKYGKIEGLIQTYSKTGHLLSECNVINNLKKGEEIEYFQPNEIDSSIKNKKQLPKISLVWNNDMIHGAVKTWYNNGQLESQKEYSKNKKNGLHTAWYKNGSLMFIEEYENDFLNKASYYKKNESDPISTIINGNGIATIYDADGIFLQKISYQSGKINE